MPDLSIETFGPWRERFDSVLIVPHDGDEEIFLRDNPGIQDAVGLDPALLRQYLRIERDLGSNQLARETARQLSDGIGTPSVAVLHANLPRGIIDPNREPKIAMRNIFDIKTFPPEFAMELLQGHRKVITETRNFLRDRLAETGVFLDIHTMAPFSRKEGVTERPDNLREYVDSWLNEANRGDRRPVDIVTEIQEEGGIGISVADTRFALALNRYLHESGIPSAFNVPYFTQSGIMTTEYMRSFRGLAIDVPKDWVSNKEGHSPDFDLANPVIDQKRIRWLAAPIVQAIQSCINR